MWAESVKYYESTSECSFAVAGDGLKVELWEFWKLWEKTVQ